VLKKECVPSHNHKKCPEPCTVDAIVAGRWGGRAGDQWYLIWQWENFRGKPEALNAVMLLTSVQKKCKDAFLIQITAASAISNV